jgi:predicted ATPase
MTAVCSPLHSDTALYPFIELIHRVLRVRPDDPVAVKLERLQEVLSGLNFPVEDTEDILAVLLSLKRDFGDAFEKLAPAQRQQRTFDAILDWMLEVAMGSPVLFVLEDLQAADLSTLDLIEQGLDRFKDTPTLMLLVARDEFRPGWGRHGDIVDMRLRRLDTDAIKAIINDVARGFELPRELVEQIKAKSDGVPLYAEEFTKMVVEPDLLVKSDGKYELVRAVSNLAIPSSLQDSLMAQLDRLRDGKGVAQWGAAIGREFSCELIKAYYRTMRLKTD